MLFETASTLCLNVEQLCKALKPATAFTCLISYPLDYQNSNKIVHDYLHVHASKFSYHE